MHPLAAWECEWDAGFFSLSKKRKKKLGPPRDNQVIVRAFVPTASYRAQQLG